MPTLCSSSHILEVMLSFLSGGGLRFEAYGTSRDRTCAPAVEVPSLNHWTTGSYLFCFLLPVKVHDYISTSCFINDILTLHTHTHRHTHTHTHTCTCTHMFLLPSLPLFSNIVFLKVLVKSFPSGYIIIAV